MVILNKLNKLHKFSRVFDYRNGVALVTKFIEAGFPSIEWPKRHLTLVKGMGRRGGLVGVVTSKGPWFNS